MTNILLVGIGGFLGSVARYKLGSWLLLSADARFPLGTFVINVTGCLVIGVLAGLAERHAAFTPEAKLFLFTGLLGGFTTFSAFGLETVLLLRRGEPLVATAYVGLSVLLGVAAVWLGIKTIEWLPRWA
ncbi:fluoride efflux transporter CrcB [Corticibacter populi]|uniref:Fluoride-specific ion channel FluC n=1 Tax=Corticibacter populi TaxID=1550736 RepID=A0A3M6QRT4_9BURK|nr:fluoride efflux transporter CrcB [Corticibacter populi]RMX05754.1 fluoride efflux transporter CrcB [Corticibacter populi]RZS30945.1 camphor resistance protein CrcB [Corticibacter populi]